MKENNKSSQVNKFGFFWKGYDRGQDATMKRFINFFCYFLFFVKKQVQVVPKEEEEEEEEGTIKKK